MDARPLKLRIIWDQPVPSEFNGNAAVEFGMQRGRSELEPGVGRPDGTTVYETDVTAFTDKQGRIRFRGPCVQGSTNEPFLYLSFRALGHDGWIGRGKALLTSLTESAIEALPEDAVLDTTMSRLGHRDAHHVQEWRLSK